MSEWSGDRWSLADKLINETKREESQSTNIIPPLLSGLKLVHCSRTDAMEAVIQMKVYYEAQKCSMMNLGHSFSKAEFGALLLARHKRLVGDSIGITRPVIIIIFWTGSILEQDVRDRYVTSWGQVSCCNYKYPPPWPFNVVWCIKSRKKGSREKGRLWFSVVFSFFIVFL